MTKFLSIDWNPYHVAPNAALIFLSSQYSNISDHVQHDIKFCTSIICRLLALCCGLITEFSLVILIMKRVICFNCRNISCSLREHPNCSSSLLTIFVLLQASPIKCVIMPYREVFYCSHTPTYKSLDGFREKVVQLVYTVFWEKSLNVA